jgi:hypothetical protein
MNEIKSKIIIVQDPEKLKPVVAEATAPLSQNNEYQEENDPKEEQEFIVNWWRKADSVLPPEQENTVPEVAAKAKLSSVKLPVAVNILPVDVEVSTVS